MKNASAWMLLFFFSPVSVYADQLIETFSSAAKNSVSSTAVWNIPLGIVHPTLQVTNYQVTGFPVVPVTDFSVGNGSDGAFNSGTFANFGTVSGTEIIVNAVSKPELQVTSFHLPSGFSLTAINGPLKIYSQSTVVIEGTINCDGRNGSGASGVNGGSGGAGRCGGLSGGSGGSFTLSGTDGTGVSATLTGGDGAQYNGVDEGAGGGGGAAFSGNDGSNGSNSVSGTNTLGAGGLGSSEADHDFTNLSGSPGGGGGSGSSTEGGGGGGGGGGTVVIHAVGNVSVSGTGLILARGGSGGSANTGGGGGGGGGGSVKIFTIGDLILDGGTVIDVTGGSGGTPVSANAGAGGTGSFGRTWLNYSNFSGTGSESHGSLLQSGGTIEYKTVSQEIESLSYDVSSTTVQYNSITTGSASTDATLQVAGSTDNFVANDTGWVAATSISGLNNRRYIKYKFTLSNSSPTTPLTVTSVTIDYNPNISSPSPSPSPSTNQTLNTNEYQFTGGCGSLKDISSSGGPSSGHLIKNSTELIQILTILLLLFLPLYLNRHLRNTHLN